MFAAGGFSFAGSAPNQGILFAQLKDFKDRRGRASTRRKALVGQLFGAFSQITGAMVIPFLPPSIQGLGQFGGFTYELLDQSGGPIENLEAAAQQLIAQGNQTPGLTGAVHAVHRRTIRSSSSTSIASRRRASACRSATSPTRCRSCSGRPT